MQTFAIAGENGTWIYWIIRKMFYIYHLLHVGRSPNKTLH